MNYCGSCKSCSNCGFLIDGDDLYCENCGMPQNNNGYSSNVGKFTQNTRGFSQNMSNINNVNIEKPAEKVHFGLTLFGFFFPGFAAIAYLSYRKKFPKRADKIIYGTCVRTCLNLSIGIILFLIGILMSISDL